MQTKILFQTHSHELWQGDTAAWSLLQTHPWSKTPLQQWEVLQLQHYIQAQTKLAEKLQQSSKTDTT